jgi:basic membrane protein A
MWYRHLLCLLGALVLVWGSPAKAQAPELKIALVYSIGYKLDKSFNESAYHAVIDMRSSGYDIQEFAPRNISESRTMLERAAKTAAHVIAIGFTHTENLKAIAPKYPHTYFTLIDSTVRAPNVQSIVFRTEEGAFLAGVAAATSSRDKTIGFVGGMYSELIRTFQAGYEQGARYADPDINIISHYIGNDIHAFSNPMSGYLVAMDEIDKGADVLFAAAGSSGLGVYQAADETINYAIGVDSDQNYLFPTAMLTSLVKDVGRVVTETIDRIGKGKWSPSSSSFGLREGAFHLSINEYNRLLLSKEAVAAIKNAQEEIIAERITIHPHKVGAAPVGVPSLH